MFFCIYYVFFLDYVYAFFYIVGVFRDKCEVVFVDGFLGSGEGVVGIVGYLEVIVENKSGLEEFRRFRFVLFRFWLVRFMGFRGYLRKLRWVVLVF